MGNKTYAGGAVITFLGILASAIELAYPNISWGLDIGIPAIIFGLGIIAITSIVNWAFDN